MPRTPDAPSRIELLVLSSLARLPMHGYEVKMELRYKHVRWWAKCEHGHLYAALKRLERRGHVVRRASGGYGRGRRVYAITTTGRRRLVETLGAVGRAADSTFFDVDLFLAGSFAVDQAEAAAILEARRRTLSDQLAEAKRLRQAMRGRVPAVGQLIMAHRVEHLTRELAFAVRAARMVRAQRRWRPFLGSQRIADFVGRSRVPLEAPGPAYRSPSVAPRRVAARGSRGT